ncbi:MAG: CARDB domain-containing protein, partial [Myxococcota bacterium]|nr:CARDB domain-containing protein [Myxococcota bacterium]
DLGEWWVVNRQDPVNKDLGGGFTDDVEFFPEIGLTDYTREGTSGMSRQGTNEFVDALWNSSIMDQEAGYQPQYADVEHTAEPSGMSFQLNTMLRYGNPEGIERMLKTAKTVDDVFLNTQSDDSKHFKGNHMSATKIAKKKKHLNDIPLNGRALSPVAWLRWYNQNPAADTIINDWLEGWIIHSRSTDKDKPTGIFPASIWTENLPANQIPGNNDVYEFEFGTPGVEDWWSGKFAQYGFGAFPSYQYYLYDLAAQSVIDAQSPTSLAFFSEPFDAMVSHGLTYVDLGSPELDKDSTPNNFSGGPEAWAGKKIATKFNVATLSHVADYLGTPSADVQRYMDAFASDYTRYRLDPTDPTPILESYDYYKSAVFDKWPFSTSEGVMTDRIAVSPGIFSYVLGVDVFALYFGMPKAAVTWKDSGQLFSAAVSKATSEVVEASLYRFADNTKNVGARFWSLEEGGVYRITTGPAIHAAGDETGGLGAAPDPSRQNEWHVQTFVYEHRNQVIEFPLPGREVYALRLEQIASAINPQPRADLAIGSEDVVLNASSNMIDVTVHNIGRVASLPVSLKVVELRDGQVFVLGEQELPSIEAPLELVDQSYTLSFPATGLTTLSRVRVEIDREDDMHELCETNNVLISGLDGQEHSTPYPYASHTSTAKVRAGRTFEVYGTNLGSVTTAELNEGENAYFEILSAQAQSVKVRVSNQAPKGQHFLSLVSSAGEKTNLFSMKILSAKKLSAKRASRKKSIDMGYFRSLAGCAATPLSLWICLPLLGLLRRRKKTLKPGV